MTITEMNANLDQDDLIQLEPFVHQVGGHSSMFVLDDETVCKPLIRREYQFYRTLPPEIKKFTPEFRGSLKVIIQEDGNDLSIAGLPNEQTVLLRNTHGSFKKAKAMRRLSSSSYDSSSSNEEDEIQTDGKHQQGSTSDSELSGTRGTPKNPWLAECHKSHLKKLQQKSDTSNVVECIMLENLTFKFRYPCVLDLKMGTRQYGDDATESKQCSQTLKAANTTTASLGVRLVGMQVYNKEKKYFTCKNKYYGRQLNEDTFKSALRQFLHNGVRLHLEAAKLIVSKLKDLRSIISKLESFRFFTSSLLILYDSFDAPYKLPRKDSISKYDTTKNASDSRYESPKNSRTELISRYDTAETENIYDTSKNAKTGMVSDISKNSRLDTSDTTKNTKTDMVSKYEKGDVNWDSYLPTECKSLPVSPRPSDLNSKFSLYNSQQGKQVSLGDKDSFNDSSNKCLANEKDSLKILTNQNESYKRVFNKSDSSFKYSSNNQPLSPKLSKGNEVYKQPYKQRRRKIQDRLKPKVDIRLIDFAHSTNQDMGDANTYKGSDEGILQGLDSLIKIFDEIRETHKDSN